MHRTEEGCPQRLCSTAFVRHHCARCEHYAKRRGSVATRLCALLMLTAPSAALAQIPWESPQLLRPGSPAGLSILYVDYGLDPLGGRGAALIFRSKTAPAGFALRVSAAHGAGDHLNFAGGNVNLAAGFDVSDPLLKASGQFPLDVIWTWGIGGSYGEHVQIALPVGLAAARTGPARTQKFYPYASARAVAEGRIGSSGTDNNLSLGLAVDVGADLILGESRDYVVQVAASLGDRPALVAGLHLGGGSPVRATPAAPARPRR
jgi:hypothetical protein